MTRPISHCPHFSNPAIIHDINTSQWSYDLEGILHWCSEIVLSRIYPNPGLSRLVWTDLLLQNRPPRFTSVGHSAPLFWHNHHDYYSTLLARHPMPIYLSRFIGPNNYQFIWREHVFLIHTWPCFVVASLILSLWWTLDNELCTI